MGGERFVTVLTRNTVAAALVAIVLLIALPRHAGVLWDFVDVFTVAFCFTFLGHYVDALLLAVPDIAVGFGRVVRVLGWFAGGLWCYLAARWCWTQYGRDVHALPRLLWGGAFLVCLELVVHAVMRARGRPNFYD